MKITTVFFLLFLNIIPGTYLCRCHAAAKGMAIHENLVISSVYSPYRTIEIKAEVAGRIKSLPVEEGNVLKPGKPLLLIDTKTQKAQKKVLQKTMVQLTQEEKLLEETVSLRKKSYERYLRLYQTQKIPEQTLDNARLEWLASRRSLIQNRQEQLRLKSDMITIEDIILKAKPVFPAPMYISRIYVEPHERVEVGQPLARLMDVSKARLKLVIAPHMFKPLVSRLKNGDRIPFTLLCSDKTPLQLSGTVEKLKEDRDSDYLYSYSLDLVFKPRTELLWGEVVQVELQDFR